MPIYEYACKNCGHQLEVLQKVSDAPLLDCPECGKANLEKIVSHTSFQLKGSGWYVTDFKNNDKKTAEKKTSTDSTEKAEPAKQNTKEDKGT